MIILGFQVEGLNYFQGDDNVGGDVLLAIKAY
jgi:hypothetical protein